MNKFEKGFLHVFRQEAFLYYLYPSGFNLNEPVEYVLTDLDI